MNSNSNTPSPITPTITNKNGIPLKNIQNNFPINTNINITKDFNTSLLDIVNFISFCSPVIITLSIFIFSIYANILSKGFAYLFFIIVIMLFRMMVYLNIPNKSNSIPKCNTYPLFSNDNITLGTYILSFTFFYLTFPMYIGNFGINVMVIVFVLFYLLFDISFKLYNNCFGTIQFTAMRLFFELLGGAGLGMLFSSFLLAYSKPLLFNTTLPSNRVSCNVPSRQTFKCSVYKNGEIIGQTNI